MLRIGQFSIRWPDDVGLEIGIANSSHVPVLESFGFILGAEIKGSIEPGGAERPALLAFDDDEDGLFEPLRLLEETTYELVACLPFNMAAALRLREQSGLRQWPFVNPAIAPHIQILSPRLWKQDGSEQTLVSAFFNPKGYVGVVDLTLLDSRHRLRVEVVSAKLGYEQEFKRLLTEVAEQHIQLIYEIGSVSGTRLSATADQQPDLPTALFHLRRLMSFDELPAAVETILSAPLETLISFESAARSAGSNHPDPAFMAARISQMAVQAGGPLAGLFRGCTPRRIPQKVKKQTFDNPENRYVKGFLHGLAELLVILHEACLLDERWIQEEEIQRWMEVVYEWIDNGIWAGVGELSSIPDNSQRLQKSAGYRDVLRADIELRDALELPWDQMLDPVDSLLGDVKPVATLYEYWCYFTLRRILRGLYGPDTTAGKGIVFRSKGKLTMRLAEDTEGRGAIFRENLPEGVSIRLFFNRRFRPYPEEQWGKWSGTYSVSFDPDISIAVETPAESHWLNFDAKYRLEKFQWEDAAQETERDYSGPQQQAYRQDDLNKMHCYRDAILGTRGAYVLYPGQPLEAPVPYLRRAEMPRRGFAFPSIGAFPLRPGSIEQQAGLTAFIRESVSRLVSGQGYREEEGFAYFQ